MSLLDSRDSFDGLKPGKDTTPERQIGASEGGDSRRAVKPEVRGLLSPEEVRRIKTDTVREVIDRLTKAAASPERIGRRVLVWKHQLLGNEKVKDLAHRLNVSSARISQAVADASEDLYEIRNITKDSVTR